MVFLLEGSPIYIVTLTELLKSIGFLVTSLTKTLLPHLLSLAR